MKKNSQQQFLALFREEAHKYLEGSNQELLDFEKNVDRVELLDGIMRKLHNLKGSATIMGFSEISKFAHRLEDVFFKLKEEEFSSWEFDLCFSGLDLLSKMVDDQTSDSPQGIDCKDLYTKMQNLLKRKKRIHRQIKTALHKKEIDLSAFKTDIKDYIHIDVSKVDALLGMINDLTIHKGRIVKRPQEVRKILEQLKFIQKGLHLVLKSTGLSAPISGEIENISLEIIDLRDRINFLLDEMTGQAVRLDRLIDQLENASLQIRMLPLSVIFTKMERMVRDLARDKKIKLIFSGETTELDKKVIELIQDPIMHLIRNSIDHGIESPKDRKIAGKHPEGVIILNASQRGNRIIIEIEDDGAGIDIEKVKEVALKRRIISQEDAIKIDEAETHNLLFRPGFTTREEATSISGRGVGLDVVRDSLAQLQGTIRIESQRGVFTRFILDLPITIAITSVLLFTSAGNLYAIPLSEVAETIKLEKPVAGGHSVALRGREISFFSIRELLLFPPIEENIRQTLLITAIMGKEAAVAVDSIEGEEQVVIRNLGNYLGKVKNVAGAAILSDARLVLVLDLISLVQSSAIEK